MKIKNIDAYVSMDTAKLTAEVQKARAELAKQLLAMRMKQAKDTNEVSKTKKRIAIIETHLKTTRLQKQVVTK